MDRVGAGGEGGLLLNMVQEKAGAFLVLRVGRVEVCEHDRVCGRARPCRRRTAASCLTWRAPSSSCSLSRRAAALSRRAVRCRRQRRRPRRRRDHHAVHHDDGRDTTTNDGRDGCNGRDSREK